MIYLKFKGGFCLYLGVLFTSYFYALDINQIQLKPAPFPPPFPAPIHFSLVQVLFIAYHTSASACSRAAGTGEALSWGVSAGLKSTHISFLRDYSVIIIFFC